MTSFGDQLQLSFGGRFRIDLGVPSLDMFGNGVTDVARLVPKDESSPIEYLALRQIGKLDEATGMPTKFWFYHRLRAPYPQLFNNTILSGLPEPVYLAPFDLPRLEAAVEVFMAIDWRNRLVEQLASDAVSGESNDDADRFLVSCFMEDEAAGKILRLVKE
jgi:hypothetical protein